jgi:hypothetical protein
MRTRRIAAVAGAFTMAALLGAVSAAHAGGTGEHGDRKDHPTTTCEEKDKPTTTKKKEEEHDKPTTTKAGAPTTVAVKEEKKVEKKKVKPAAVKAAPTFTG